MLKRLNRLEKQYGGAIPFSALEEKDSKNKTKRKSKSNKSNKPTKKKNPINKSQTIRKHRKRSISPSRIHRNNTRKLKRSKKKTIKGKGKYCKCGSHTFTGKEKTPRALGHCEECIPLNVVMKGLDGNLYENTKGNWTKIK